LLKEIVIAIQSFSEAHRFIEKNKLLKWIVIPGVIYTILFIAGMYFFIGSSNYAVSWLSNQLRIEDWLQQERNTWLSYFFVMAGIMLRLILLLFYFSLFKYLILIIGSPVFAYLSEKTESIIEEKEYSFNWQEIKKDVYRGSKLALRNAGWQTFYSFLLLLFSLFPLVGWITPIIALFIECYYYGFAMLDYSFARNKFSTLQSIDFIGKHKGLAIGNGLLFYLLHIVIIFAPAYAIVAATLSLYKVKNI
jgi:CysZ protein